MNTGIKGVKGGHQEHKLMLYADDILGVIDDPLTSLPHLKDTIRSYSKFSGYTVSWTKSEAMPLSVVCQSHMVEKFKFRWVPKSMKYLGIRLSGDLTEMPILNFNSLLQKIKTSLDKWEKIKLTLWGKVNAIKMAIIPQFNYVVMCC